jgi:hypothetical protein
MQARTYILGLAGVALGIGVFAAVAANYTQSTQFSDQNTATISAAFGWTPFYADAGTFVGQPMTLPPGSDGFFTALAQLQVAGRSDQTGACWYQLKWGVTSTEDGGVIISPTGVDAGVTQDSQCGSQFTGQPVSLVQNGNSVQLYVNTSVTGAIKGNLDWTTGNTAPYVLSVSPATLVAEAGGNVVVTTTPGAAQSASSGVVAASVAADGGVTGGVAVNCHTTTQNTATCFVPPSSGYLSDGGLASGGVALSSAANPFPLASGFAFSGSSSGPAVSYVCPPTAHASGGETVVVHAAASFTGTPTVKFNTTSATCGTYASPLITCTTPTGFSASSTGVSVTIGGGAGSNFYFAPNAMTYLFAPCPDLVGNVSVGSNVAGITDVSGETTLSQATSSNQPKLENTAFPTGAYSLLFPGSGGAGYLATTDGGPEFGHGYGTTAYGMGGATSADAGGAPAIAFACASSSWLGINGSNLEFSSGTPTTAWTSGFHSFWSGELSDGGSIVTLDTTSGYGVSGNVGCPNGLYLGNFGSNAYPFTGNVGVFGWASSGLSSSDYTIWNGILAAVDGT